MVDATMMRIPKDLLKRLHTMQKSHQALAGVIEDLINEHQQGVIILKPETLTRLEEYRNHPRETVDDLINAVLNELEQHIARLTESK